jgi:hypothetical protein
MAASALGSAKRAPALAMAVIVYSSFPPIWRVSLATELPTADVPAVVRLRTTYARREKSRAGFAF